jgi:hypothetical protein
MEIVLKILQRKTGARLKKKIKLIFLHTDPHHFVQTMVRQSKTTNGDYTL